MYELFLTAGETIRDCWNFVSDHLIFLNFILSIIIVFFQRREPKSAWAWLLILNTIPIVGFIIYLFAGTDMHKRKMFRIKEIEDQVNDAIREQEYSIKSKELRLLNPELKSYEDLIYYNLESARAMLTGDNTVKIFTDGNDKFEALIEDIRGAEHYVFLQYYIIKNDVLFNRIKDVLIEKAAQGVEVRVLFDGMGCRSVHHKYWAQLREQGIHTAEFFPAFLRRFHLRVNYRNHRKIAIIDGMVSYVGGFNIGKEYIGLDPKFGYWRDTHLRIEGSASAELLIRFILDWNYAAKENLFRNPVYYQCFKPGKGEADIQIVSSGPDSSLQNVRNNYLRMIHKAKKKIYIQTPYFIPDESIMTALTIAVHSGVEVNIMIPCKPDHPFVYWATYSYVGDLVMAGANCYTYDNGFLHAKGMIIDGEVLSYGTANMDIRSFALNFEVNATIYDQKLATQMERIFEEDLAVCTKITKDLYLRRSLMIRFKEQVSRLLSPLL